MIHGPWDTINALFVVFALIVISLQVARSIHWSAGVAVFYCFISALAVICQVLYVPTDKTIAQITYMQELAAEALLLGVVIFAMVRSISWQLALKIISWLVIADAGIVALQYFVTGDVAEAGGFFLNPSMNSSFIAVFLPLVPIMAVPLCVLSIFLAQASIPVGVLMTVAFAYAFVCGDAKQRWGGVALVVIAGLGACFTPSLMGDSGRFGQYKASLEYWTQHIQPWIGSGAGTYYVHGTIISSIRGLKTTESWAFAHNDWLQILFECGFIGIWSFLLMIGFMLYRTWNRPKIFAIICGFCVFGALNMPLRYPFIALAMAFVMKAAFAKSPEDHYNGVLGNCN